MYLKTSSFSNLLSFGACDHGDARHQTLWSAEGDDRVNIVIGPNGSGKSNTLEIINQTLRAGWFRSYVLAPGYVQSDTPTQTIQYKSFPLRHLRKHFATSQQLASVVLSVGLTDADRDNFRFVYQQRGLIADLIQRYSTEEVVFPHFPHIQDVMRIDALEVKISVDTKHGYATAGLTSSSPALAAWYWYFEYFELFQLVLVLHNHHLDSETTLPGLHSNFAVLGPGRDFAEHEMQYGVQELSEQELDKLIHDQDMKRNHQLPVGYYLVKKQLLEMYYAGEIGQGSTIQELLADEFLASDSLRSNEMNFYQKLNYLVRKYVDLMVVPSFHDGQIVLHFVDKWNNYYTLSELSSGEQAFLAIIFTLRGYGVMDGVLIIDEPEQHLHPQMQERMLEMIQDIATIYRLQVIMSTHSPLMIHETTVNAIHRCTIQEGGTMIWSSTKSQFADDEYRLIQMLQYGYTAKVFFVDTIIMVEGETDEYFFNHYLRWLSRQPGWQSKIKHYAVINVNGKGGYRRRRSFLKRFGIASYFVGDWDNIVNTGLDVNFKKLAAEMKQETHHCFKKGKKRKDYGALTYYVYHYKPDLHRKIQKHIDAVEKRDVFILRRGDLEAYLGLEIKGVDSTVEFCHERFDRRLTTKEFHPYRKELDRMFGVMFGL